MAPASLNSDLVHSSDGIYAHTQTELAAVVKGLVKRTNRPSYHSGSYKKGSYWLQRRNPWTGTTKATAQASEDPWTACGMWLEAQQRWLEAGQTQT